MGIAQSFTAKETFDAVFEKHTQSLFGGGVQVVLWDKFVAEVGASRCRDDAASGRSTAATRTSAWGSR